MLCRPAANHGKVKVNHDNPTSMIMLHELSAPKHVYDQAKLIEIVKNYNINWHFRYKKLPIEAIKTIRSLKLNRKRRRHKYTCQKRRIQHEHEQHGSRPENLTKIKRENHRENTNIIIGAINIQSIKNKELQVTELLDNYSLDALIITETWLTCSEIDRQWYIQPH